MLSCKGAPEKWYVFHLHHWVAQGHWAFLAGSCWLPGCWRKGPALITAEYLSSINTIKLDKCEHTHRPQHKKYPKTNKTKQKSYFNILPFFWFSLLHILWSLIRNGKIFFLFIIYLFYCVHKLVDIKIWVFLKFCSNLFWTPQNHLLTKFSSCTVQKSKREIWSYELVLFYGQRCLIMLWWLGQQNKNFDWKQHKQYTSWFFSLMQSNALISAEVNVSRDSL